MRFTYDLRTRFPMLSLGELELQLGKRRTDVRLEVGLLPVTKAQFEKFLETGPAGFDSTWYEQVLTLNERVSWRAFVPERREGLFLTGIKPEEANAFARWLGEDFRLPTVEEWRAVDRYLLDGDLEPHAERVFTQHTLDPAAQTLLNVIEKRLRPETWGDLTFLRGGVFEWVDVGKNEFLALGGRTRPEFFHTVFNPQKDTPVRHFGERSGYFGFRVARRGPGTSAIGRAMP
jgi:hypothetical protein